MARRKNRKPKTDSPTAAAAPAMATPAVAASPSGTLRFAAPLGVLLLVLAAFALYAGALRNPLVFDDELLREAYLKASAEAGFRFDMRLFMHASFGWNWTLAGGQHWFGFRITNVLLHGLSGCVLFLLMRRLIGAVLPVPDGRTIKTLGTDAYAFFGALLFVLHPVAVYGTAYLVQRSILLATLFSLVSLLLFLEGLLRGPGRQAWAWSAWACYGGATLAFFIAAFSKEHCVMLPAVAVAIGILVRGATLRTLRELLLPVALLGAVSGLLLVRKYGLIGAAYEPYAQLMLSGLAESQGAPAGVESAYARSFINQSWLFFRYLGLWLVPFPGWMSIDMRPDFPAGVFSLPQSLGLLPWIAWPGVGLWLLMKGGRRGLAGLAMLFPWLLALTEFATVRVQEPFVLYRSYLWMGGLAALLPALFHALDRRAAAAILCVVAVVLVPASLERLGTFASEERVWDDAVRKLPADNAPLADRTYRARGIAAYRAEHYEPALRDIDRSLSLNPKSPESWMLRGMLLMRAGRTPESLEALDRSIALAPKLPEARARRCVVLMRLQRPQDALADCTRAVELHSSQPEARHYTSLGMANALLKRAKEAEAMYQMALLVAPGDNDANYQFGVLLAGTGQTERARPYLQHACTAGLQPACRRLGE